MKYLIFLFLLMFAIGGILQVYGAAMLSLACAAGVVYAQHAFKTRAQRTAPQHTKQADSSTTAQ